MNLDAKYGMQYVRHEETIIRRGPTPLDLARWRREAYLSSLRRKGIVLFQSLMLLHHLIGISMITPEEETTPGEQPMLDFPKVTSTSWLIALRLNYSRPPNDSTSRRKNDYKYSIFNCMKTDFKVLSEEEYREITGMISELSSNLRDVIRKAGNPMEEKWIDNGEAALSLLDMTPRMWGIDEAVDFTLTVYGTGFTPNSVVRWNGADRITGFVSSSVLTATVSVTDIGTLAIVPVTVYDPDTTPTETQPLTFWVVASVARVYLPAIWH